MYQQNVKDLSNLILKGVRNKKTLKDVQFQFLIYTKFALYFFFFCISNIYWIY